MSEPHANVDDLFVQAGIITPEAVHPLSAEERRRLAEDADRAAWWRERPNWPYPTTYGIVGREVSDDEWLAQAFREAVSRVHEYGTKADPAPMNAIAARALAEDPDHPNADEVRRQIKEHAAVEDADYNCEHPFCVKWWPMVRAAEARARLATLDAARQPVSPDLRATLEDIAAAADGMVGGLKGDSLATQWRHGVTWALERVQRHQCFVPDDEEANADIEDTAYALVDAVEETLASGRFSDEDRFRLATAFLGVLAPEADPTPETVARFDALLQDRGQTYMQMVAARERFLRGKS